MNVFQFSFDYVMGLDWDRFYYFLRRAQEIKTGKLIEEDIKVDTDAFQSKAKRLYDKISRLEQRREGTVNG